MALIPALSCSNPPPCRLLRKPRKPSKVFLTEDDEEVLRLPELSQHIQQARFSNIYNKNKSKLNKRAFISAGVQDGTSTQRTGFASPPPSEESRGNSAQDMQLEYDMVSSPRYVMDSRYREITNLGTYLPGKSLVKPHRPRGPGKFPLREPLRNPLIVHNFITEIDINDTELRYIKPPEFTLQNFLIDLSDCAKVPVEKVQQVMFSRYNYKKIQKIIADICIPKYPELSTQVMTPPDTMPIIQERMPHRHLLIQMAALVKEQMSEAMQMDMKVKILPLPKYSPHYNASEPAPHTEIVVYEAKGAAQPQKSFKISNDKIELQQIDGIFAGPGGRHFQGSNRCNSPFTVDNEGMISPTDLALLDTLMKGGTALSLKAHFLQQLPDLQPLLNTLLYINLSFNELTTVPTEIFAIEQLVVLKLRNNPIRELSNDIGRLRNLQVLIIPFCLLTHLPISLFSLQKLQHLDVAYNKLSFLPSEISCLKALEILNLEGNELPAMPAGALKLRELSELNVRRNFMHPVFWSDFSRNEPQRLVDMAATCFDSYNLLRRYKNKFLSLEVLQILKSHSVCDCCQGHLFGPGLRIIRPVRRIFNINNLPFIFRCCSVHCYNMLMQGGEALQEALYGQSEKTSSSFDFNAS